MHELDLSPFLAIRRHLRIAHHIPGRIRIRIAASVLSEAHSMDSRMFEKILGAIAGIREVRLNAAAGSIVIAYAPGSIEPSWWDTLISGRDTESTDLLRRLIDSSDTSEVSHLAGP